MNHKYNYGKRINWRTIVLSTTILWCLVASHYGNLDNTYVAQQEPILPNPREVGVVPSVEDKIKEYFPRSWKDMIAVAHAESHLNEDAKNWNCWYNKDETVVYSHKVSGSHSTSCHKEDRGKAWSVDCGVLQLSNKGKECPNETLDEHLQRAAELSKVQGKEAWVTYSKGIYKRYLTQK